MEFIAAKDLPVLEAETPDVLAVDPATGEMGRVPGANLGGGSSGAYIIDLTGLWDGASDEVTIDTISYDDFAEHWYNGGALVIRHVMEGAGVMYYYPELVGYTEGMLYITGRNGSQMFGFVFTNGTWAPPAE